MCKSCNISKLELFSDHTYDIDINRTQSMKNLDYTFIQKNTIDNIKQGQIAPSKIHGYGLFAKVDIDAMDILCVLDGQVIGWDHYIKIKENISNLAGSLEEYFFMEWNALDEETLLVRPLRTKYSYINHSRTPNVTIQRHPLRIIAMKNISIGTEITIDYRNEPLNDEYINNHGSTYL